MSSCRVDKKRTLTEHFKQLAVINLCANSGVMPQKHGIILVIIILGKCVLGRLFFEWHKRFWDGRAGISDDFRSERLRISDNAKNGQISASRYTVPEKRRVEICSSQCSGKIRCGLL